MKLLFRLKGTFEQLFGFASLRASSIIVEISSRKKIVRENPSQMKHYSRN